MAVVYEEKQGIIDALESYLEQAKQGFFDGIVVAGYSETKNGKLAIITPGCNTYGLMGVLHQLNNEIDTFTRRVEKANQLQIARAFDALDTDMEKAN